MEKLLKLLGFSVLQRQIERREHNSCRTAAQKMEVGPPESAFRSGSQTTPSGCGQKAVVVSVGGKAQGMILSRCASGRRAKANPPTTRR